MTTPGPEPALGLPAVESIIVGALADQADVEHVVYAASGGLLLKTTDGQAWVVKVSRSTWWPDR